MGENERAMYTGVAMSRNTEVTMQFTRGYFFLFVHAGLFTLTMTRGDSFTLGVASGVGYGFGIFWVVANVLTTRWIRYWERRLQLLERSIPNPTKIRSFSEQLFLEMTSKNRVTFSWLLLILSMGITGYWGVVAVFSVFS